MTKTAPKPIPQPPRQPGVSKSQRASGARDLLVRLTIPLVAAALTFALHLQLNVDVGMAVVIAALAGTCLALLHVNYQRGVVIGALKRDLLRVGHANASMRAGLQIRHRDGARALPVGSVQTQHGPGAVSAIAGGNPTPSRSVEAAETHAKFEFKSAQHDSPAVELAPMRTLPQAESRTNEAAAKDANALTTDQRSIGPELAQPTSMDTTQRSMPPVTAGPPPLPPIVLGVRPAQPVASPASEARTEPLIVEPVAKYRTPSAAEPTMAKPSFGEAPEREPRRELAAATETGDDTPAMAPYWALRPGMYGEPQAPSPAEPESNQHAQFDEFVSTRPASEQIQREGPYDASISAGAHGENPAIDPVAGPELEAMQKLIEQLATQLNGPSVLQSQAIPNAAVPPAVEEQSSPTVAQSVATSVAALRATADTMRSAADSAAAMRLPAPVLVPTTSAQRVADEPSGVPSSHAQATVVNEPPMPAQAGQEKRARQGRYARLVEASAAIAAERIDVLLDPILGLGDRKARHFEVSVRLRNEFGTTIEAEGLAEISAGSGLMPKLDAAKLARTARIAGRLEARGTSASLFSTLAGESLEEQSFLDVFDEVFAGETALLNRVVLSFSQHEVRQFTAGHWQAIETMADMGLRLAIEDVVDLDLDFEGLREHGFDFVKLDAKVFLEGLRAPEGLLPAEDICRHFSSVGLALIVGHIEDEASLSKVQGSGVIFGQGALFGGARPVSIDTTPPPRTAAA